MLRKKLRRRKIFIIMKRNYKCMRRHKRRVYKYSLHVNNSEIDQEKQNKTVSVVIYWKGGEVSRKSKLIFYAKY